MRLFDTRIQLMKYKVLKEIIARGYEDDLTNIYYEIPKKLIPGPNADMRCCIYKERAVLEERIRMAIGGDKKNPNVVEVLDVACDECPVETFFVTEACRGCIAHRCIEACPFDAISIVNKRAVIDKSKCKECGRCFKACSYGAIIENVRPCVRSCKAGAIKIDENKKVRIDNSKCVMCGACVYQCPWGALQDKSYVLDVVNLLRKSNRNQNYRMYAVIAPSIVSQFKYAKIGQVVTGIKQLGFHQVIEAALGADITLYKEANEFAEKGRMTTSCCPSFVMYIEKNFPKLVEYISHSPSPMIETANLIKATDPEAKVVFIGPCISKKYEARLEKTKGAIDQVITFEELQAFLDARNIDVEQLEESVLDNASFYGRIFAKAGGIAEGLPQVAGQLGIQADIKPLSLNGIEQCKLALLKMNLGKLEENFLEGMACEGGCINGPACLHHGPKSAMDVDQYGKAAREHDISNSLKLYEMTKQKQAELLRQREEEAQRESETE